MSRHVKPHRWADLLSGKVDAAERETMESHAEACGRCAAARARVARASDSFPSIRAQSAPELPWDSVRARVHWSVSKAKRDGQGAPPARWPALAWAAGVVVATGAIALVSGPVATRPVVGADGVAVAPVAPPPAPAVKALAPAKKPEPAALAGLVTRATAGDVLIDGAQPADLFAQKIDAGTVIATGDAAVDVQFGDASGFTLAPHSTLDVVRFDAEAIELAVEGMIDIEVAPRAPGQTFVVLAGERAIEVRGTQFRVRHDAKSTAVACRHGLVAVRDRASGKQPALVGAARRVELPTGAQLADARVVALTVAELDALAEATPLRVPLWDPDTLVAASAPLEIGGAGRREVRVDGIEVGKAPVRVRVMPGRHTVEAMDASGRYQRAGWVDVGRTPARLDVRADGEQAPATGTGVTTRRAQLRAGIDRARLGRCTRSIRKQGLTGTYVQVEMAVDASGAVGFLNVVDTDLPSTIHGCVREVLADVRFQAGPAATWRERIDL
ncbi:MAG: FecR domain-containing protein [Myxococcales bacterium]|nr:FecR domain-containing protein [Myxococcales bacterium]